MSSDGVNATGAGGGCPRHGLYHGNHCPACLDEHRPPTGLVRVVRYGPAEFERATEYLGEERITFRYTSEGIVFWAPERGEGLLTNEKMAEALRKAKAEHDEDVTDAR